MKKSIEPRNDKRKAHGYWETNQFSRVLHKRYYLNGKLNGYQEFIYRDDVILNFHL